MGVGRGVHVSWCCVAKLLCIIIPSVPLSMRAVALILSLVIFPMSCACSDIEGRLEFFVNHIAREPPTPVGGWPKNPQGHS